VTLVGVAGFVDTAFQLDATALLDDVRRFVGDSVQIRAAQDDVIAGGVCIGAHRARGCSGIGPGVSLDRRRVVVPEGTLDRVGERQGGCRCRYALRGNSVGGGRVALVALDGCALLHHWCGDLLDQGPLASGRLMRLHPRTGLMCSPCFFAEVRHPVLPSTPFCVFDSPLLGYRTSTKNTPARNSLGAAICGRRCAPSAVSRRRLREVRCGVGS
jgi:hypothetical protein